MQLEDLQALAASGQLSEDDILKLTQGTRQAMLSKVLASGLPEGKDMYRVMNLLNDMDGTALKTKEMDNANDQADLDRRAAMFIHGVTQNLGTENPFLAQNPQQGGRVLEPDKDAIPHIVPTKEQTAVGVSDMTYEKFIEDGGEIDFSPKTED